MRYWVYIHTCPNGKKYVGVTIQEPEKRWCSGWGYFQNRPFFADILKYGWDNFTHELFEVESEDAMYESEIKLIYMYKSNNPQYGYNISTGGRGPSGCIRSEETVNLMHKPKSENHRKHISEAALRRVKHKYLLPDGTIKFMDTAVAARHYTSKGIQIQIVEEN